jgi:hypothetical protein
MRTCLSQPAKLYTLSTLVRLPPFPPKAKEINNSGMGRTVPDSFLILKH